jgi:ABC-type branched-subunit amino acid transport system substrate-binding protein
VKRRLREPRSAGKLVSAAIAVLVVGVALAACGDDDAGSGGDAGAGGDADIKIGNILPLTGANAPFAPASQKSSQLAVEQVKAAAKEAGADGISVSMKIEDGQTSEQGAVQAARKAVAEGANILVGGWTSGGTIAASKAVGIPQGIPFISSVSTSTAITDLEDEGLVSRIIPADDVQAQSVAQVAAEKLGNDATLSVAAVNEAYGSGFAEDFKEVWEAGGGTTTGPVLYDPTGSEFDSEAEEIVSGDPDGFVFASYPDSFAKLTRSLLRTGKYDGEKSFFSEALGALDSLKGTGILPTALQGGTGTQPAAPTTTAAARAFDELFRSSSLKPADRFTYDTHTFDTVMLAALAGIAAGSSDSEAIAEKVRAVSSPPGDQYTFEELADAIKALQDGQDIDFEGVSGPLNQDENGDLTAESAFFNAVTFNAQGEREVLREFQLESGGAE